MLFVEILSLVKIRSSLEKMSLPLETKDRPLLVMELSLVMREGKMMLLRLAMRE